MTGADVAAAVRAIAGSLRMNRKPPPRIASVVLIGSTCVGKSTLVSAVRSAALPDLDVPRRFVTRAPRPGDCTEEATHLANAELDAAIAAGTITLHWSRTFESGHVERYGFAHPRPGRTPLYSANNAICQLGMPDALVIGVFAPDEVRERRLRARSPELVRDRPAEANARLAESGAAILPYAHVIVDNHGEHEASAPRELVTLLRALTST